MKRLRRVGKIYKHSEGEDGGGKNKEKSVIKWLNSPTSVREKNKQLFPGQNAWILPCFFRFYCHVFDPEYKFLPSTFFDRRARSAKGRGRKLFFFSLGRNLSFFCPGETCFFLPRKKLFFHLHFIDPLSAWRLFKS